MFVNYFVNNAREVITFEAWILWQLFTGNNFTSPTSAKLEYFSEIKNAITANKDGKLHERFAGYQQNLNIMSSSKLAKVYERAIDSYNEMIAQSEYRIEREKIQENIRDTINNLNQIISTISNKTEYAALQTFKATLEELLENIETVNSVRPITFGMLDTSGADNIWSKMIAKNDAVYCLNDTPEEYKSVKIYEAVDTMCQELMHNFSVATRVRALYLIDPPTIPVTDWESIDQRLQVYAAHTLLESFRNMWATSQDKVADYNKRTYVIEIISRLFRSYHVEGLFNLVWANLRKPQKSQDADMHAVISLERLNNAAPTEDAAQSKIRLEILFLVCSTPTAEASKFISDWIRLLHMCKKAHNVINKTINDRLHNIEGGERILERLRTIPIILMQVYRNEVKFAILDKPYGAYHRVRVLETLEILLTPPDNLDTLKAFVYAWLRLQAYVKHVASLLQDIWHEIDELERTSFNSTEESNE